MCRTEEGRRNFKRKILHLLENKTYQQRREMRNAMVRDPHKVRTELFDFCVNEEGKRIQIQNSFPLSIT